MGLVEHFDLFWPRVIRVAGLTIALWEVFIEQMQHPEVLLIAGPMMGLANLLKESNG